MFEYITYMEEKKDMLEIFFYVGKLLFYESFV